MTLLEEVVIQYTVEDAEVVSGTDRIARNLNRVSDLAEEAGTQFGRLGDIISGVTSGALAFGAAILGSLVAPLTASPQFKQFMSSLSEPFNRLSRNVGQNFKGALDSASQAFRRFVNYVTTDPDAQEVLGIIGDNVETTIDVVANVLFGDEDTKGLLNVLSDIVVAGDNIVRNVSLSLGITADQSQKALLAGMLVATGNPFAMGLAAMIVGQTAQETLGPPEKFRERLLDVGGNVGGVTSGVDKWNRLRESGRDMPEVGFMGAGTQMMNWLGMLRNINQLSTDVTKRNFQTVKIMVDQATNVTR